MKKILIIIIMLMVLTACSPKEDMVNPTPVYCEQNGNELEIHTADDGSQSGVCVFPDGSTCDEWAYFHGECGSTAQQSTSPAVTVEATKNVMSGTVKNGPSGYMPSGTSEEFSDWWGVIKSTPTGAHIFNAVGFTAGGREIGSKTISEVFVSNNEEDSAASLKMVIPILAVVFGVMTISAITTMVNVRKGKKLPAGAARSYSFGGGICPKCKRPFGFQLLGIHMFGRKLTPCPHCGKWSVVKQATMGELHAAELAELDTEKAQIHDIPDEEKLRKS